MKTNKLYGTTFCGNEASDYAKENGYLDYATFAKAFDAVMNNSIMENTCEIGYWEQENGIIDNSEEIESVTIGTEGLELNFSDGTGYYIETDVTPDSGYINVNDIKGWETWNDNEKVYLSVGDWVISKEPYTTNTKAERME